MKHAHCLDHCSCIRESPGCTNNDIQDWNLIVDRIYLASIFHSLVTFFPSHSSFIQSLLDVKLFNSHSIMVVLGVSSFSSAHFFHTIFGVHSSDPQLALKGVYQVSFQHYHCSQNSCHIHVDFLMENWTGFSNLCASQIIVVCTNQCMLLLLMQHTYTKA
jgi:hypothetical protein